MTPFAGMKVTEPGVEILPERHCLSEESAIGFRKLMNRGGRRVIVMAGTRDLSVRQAREMRRRVIAGEWLVFESAPDYSAQQARSLEAAFGIRVGARFEYGAWAGEYVEYQAPVKRLVRPFLGVVAVDERDGTLLARIGGINCAVARLLGQGKIIFLGSMLGPGLFGEEREAHEVARALLS